LGTIGSGWMGYVMNVKRRSMRHAVSHQSPLNARAFAASQPPVCPEHGKSTFALQNALAIGMIHADFLDTTQDILSSGPSVVAVISQAAGEVRRAFSFSKSHARCMIDNGVWRWKNGII